MPTRQREGEPPRIPPFDPERAAMSESMFASSYTHEILSSSDNPQVLRGVVSRWEADQEFCSNRSLPALYDGYETPQIQKTLRERFWRESDRSSRENLPLMECLESLTKEVSLRKTIWTAVATFAGLRSEVDKICVGMNSYGEISGLTTEHFGNFFRIPEFGKNLDGAMRALNDIATNKIVGIQNVFQMEKPTAEILAKIDEILFTRANGDAAAVNFGRWLYSFFGEDAWNSCPSGKPPVGPPQGMASDLGKIFHHASWAAGKETSNTPRGWGVSGMRPEVIAVPFLRYVASADENGAAKTFYEMWTKDEVELRDLPWEKIPLYSFSRWTLALFFAGGKDVGVNEFLKKEAPPEPGLNFLSTCRRFRQALNLTIGETVVAKGEIEGKDPRILENDAKKLKASIFDSWLQAQKNAFRWAAKRKWDYRDLRPDRDVETSTWRADEMFDEEAASPRPGVGKHLF